MSTLFRAKEGGVYNWHTAVKCLLESYATNEEIHEAVSNFRAIKKRLPEDEQALKTHFVAAHARDSFFMRDRALVTSYIEALNPRLRPTCETTEMSTHEWG